MYKNTVDYLKNLGMVEPEVAIILGSGLGDLVDKIEDPIAAAYEDIPDFPQSTVEGHAGQLVYGKLSGKTVIVLQGRFHFYEGYDVQTVAYPVRIFHELGAKTLVITNACGAANEDFTPGELMIITDYINITGQSPLIGKNVDEHGPRFVDVTETFSKRLRDELKDIAKENDIPIQEGVYYWHIGPAYETPAEVRMAQVLGADAVGMSTVPEAIVGKHCGMEVVGISALTNMAPGLQASVSHDSVVEMASRIKPRFEKVVTELIKRI